MAASVGHRMHQDTLVGGYSEEVSLPCILGRLSRLEHEGFSYGELLHDFASRRRVGPLNVEEEHPAKHVLDPAEETDQIVQVRRRYKLLAPACRRRLPCKEFWSKHGGIARECYFMFT